LHQFCEKPLRIIFKAIYSLKARTKLLEKQQQLPLFSTSVLNFIRRNVHCCPPFTKATAYISLVCSHLEYAAAAWEQL